MTGILIVKPFAAVSSGAEISIDDHSFSGPTEAWFWVSNVGMIYGSQGQDNVTVVESWIAPQFGMAGYEVMVHQVSGNALGTESSIVNSTIPPLDTWLQLNTLRAWGYGSTHGARSGTFEVTIRRISDSVVMDSATFTLYTPGDPGSGGDGGDVEGGFGTGSSGSIFDGIYLNSA